MVTRRDLFRSRRVDIINRGEIRPQQLRKHAGMVFPDVPKPDHSDAYLFHAIPTMDIR